MDGSSVEVDPADRFEGCRGYAPYRTERSEFDGGKELWLPIPLVWQLREERRELALARELERRAEDDRLRAERLASTPAVPSVASLPTWMRDPVSFIKRFEGDVARRNPRRLHPVLRAAELLRVGGKVNSLRDKDYQKREHELLEKVQKLGALRQVANPCFGRGRWNESLADLREAHPHFEAVTELIAGRVALSRCSNEPLRIPPLHLWGEPGLGKTHYARDLARALGAPVRIQSMENAQTTALLLGSERHWSTASQGIIFEQVVLGSHANPVFVIDELDKAARGTQYDPLAPFHSLLEPSTADKVRDASLDIVFDASLAIYIATSNDPSRVPGSLRSRMIEFEIRAPQGEQALQVARAVVRSTVLRSGVRDFAQPNPSLAHKLAHLSPREIGHAVRNAVAAAVADGRRYLVLTDLPADCQPSGTGRGLLH